MFLREGTAQVILFGPALDITDGVTEMTSLTLAQADMRLSKDGGAFAQKSASGNATHDSDGWYNTTLSTTDTGTVGELKLNVHQPANMLPLRETYWVLEQAVYDLLFGSGADGEVTVAALNANVITAASIATAAFLAAKFGAAAITSTVLADDAITANKIATSAMDDKGNWNVGKTGYSLSQVFPTNFADLAIVVSSGRVTVGDMADNAIHTNALVTGCITAAKLGTACIEADKFAAGAINAAAIATDALVAAKFSATACDKMADHFWRRLVANVEASSDGDTIGTNRGAYVVLAKANNKVAVNGTDLETMQDDDTTVVLTQAITSDPAAEPITGLDTA